VLIEFLKDIRVVKPLFCALRVTGIYLTDVSVSLLRFRSPLDSIKCIVYLAVRVSSPHLLDQLPERNRIVFQDIFCSRLSNTPVVRLRLVLDLSDERSGISTEAAKSGRGGEAGWGV
jgi:hypothetical protein